MKLKELGDHWQNNNEVLKGVWGKQEGFILGGSWSVNLGGYWSVNGRVGRWLREKGRLLNGNWLVSDCFTTTSGGVPAPSFLLPHNYLIIEHWLVNTESWFLVWYLGPSKWLNLGRMMGLHGKMRDENFCKFVFFPHEQFCWNSESRLSKELQGTQFMEVTHVTT